MPGTPQETAHTRPTLILAVLSLAGLAYAVLSSAVIPALPSFQHEAGSPALEGRLATAAEPG
jgi:hypothetical protein